MAAYLRIALTPFCTRCNARACNRLWRFLRSSPIGPQGQPLPHQKSNLPRLCRSPGRHWRPSTMSDG